MPTNVTTQAPPIGVPFSDLPDDARLWSFAASRPLTEDETERLLGRVDEFLTGWHAHRRAVTGAREWAEGRFLFIAADERATGVSGCSIDSLFHTLRQAEREMGVSLTDSSRVWFRDSVGEIKSVSRPEFGALAAAREVGPDTHVFDQTISTVGDLRAGRWEAPLRTTWHARAFPVTA